MPIYEYKCESCGHVLDALQKIDEEPLKYCPSCSEASLRKLISAPSFRLKGSGWYETDFKKDKKRNLADSGEPAKKQDSGAAEKGAKDTAGGAADKSTSSASSTTSKGEGGG